MATYGCKCLFFHSNKSQLKKLLLDYGGLRLALQPLGDEDDEDDDDEEHGGEQLFDSFNPPHSGVTSQYFSLLTGCLSALMSAVKSDRVTRNPGPVVLGEDDRDTPPPVKNPRLVDTCPYGDSDFDLVLLLDDGTQVPANREAVGVAERSDRTGSEYFRALLRSGFGEAQGGATEPIRIRDVSGGVLLPVLHYLHGCRFGKAPRCPVLDSLAHDGPVSRQDGTRDFQETPLGEAMVGAGRFLVNELQRELEDILVSFLWSRSAEDGAEKTGPETGRESGEPAEENLASLTSELELTGRTKNLKTLLQETESRTIRDVLTRLNTGLDPSTIQKMISDSKPVLASANKPLDPEEKPKNSTESVSSPSEAAARSEVLLALLPRLFWFSQRYSYPSLGRACLSLLLGREDGSPTFSDGVAAGCLRRLSREADCRESLKQNLQSLVSEALS